MFLLLGPQLLESIRKSKVMPKLQDPNIQKMVMASKKMMYRMKRRNARREDNVSNKDIMAKLHEHFRSNMIKNSLRYRLAMVIL